MIIHEYQGNQFLTLISPSVYIWRRGKEVLFVGGTICGLGRFNNTRLIAGREILGTDTIELISCKESELRNLVREYTDKLQPKYHNKGSNSQTEKITTDMIGIEIPRFSDKKGE
jgi:hypothetical protein